jgi:hypothetical protein
MNVKILRIRRLQGTKFEIITAVDSKWRKFVILERKDVVVNGMPPMSRIISETPGFEEVWGSSLEFRKSLSNKISEMGKSKTPQMKAKFAGQYV